MPCAVYYESTMHVHQPSPDFVHVVQVKVCKPHGTSERRSLRVYAKKRKAKKEPAYGSGRQLHGINEAELFASMTRSRAPAQQQARNETLEQGEDERVVRNDRPSVGSDIILDDDVDFLGTGRTDPPPTYGQFELLLFEEDEVPTGASKSLLKAKRKTSVAAGAAITQPPNARTLKKQYMSAVEQRLYKGRALDLGSVSAPVDSLQSSTLPGLLNRPTWTGEDSAAPYDRDLYSSYDQASGALYQEFQNSLQLQRPAAAAPKGKRNGKGGSSKAPSLQRPNMVPTLAAKPVLRATKDGVDDADEGWLDDNDVWDPQETAAWLEALQDKRRRDEQDIMQAPPALVSKPLIRPGNAAKQLQPTAQALETQLATDTLDEPQVLARARPQSQMRATARPAATAARSADAGTVAPVTQQKVNLAAPPGRPAAAPKPSESVQLPAPSTLAPPQRQQRHSSNMPPVPQQPAKAKVQVQQQQLAEAALQLEVTKPSVAKGSAQRKGGSPPRLERSAGQSERQPAPAANLPTKLADDLSDDISSGTTSSSTASFSGSRQAAQLASPPLERPASTQALANSVPLESPASRKAPANSAPLESPSSRQAPVNSARLESPPAAALAPLAPTPDKAVRPPSRPPRPAGPRKALLAASASAVAAAPPAEVQATSNASATTAATEVVASPAAAAAAAPVRYAGATAAEGTARPDVQEDKSALVANRPDKRILRGGSSGPPAQRILRRLTPFARAEQALKAEEIVSVRVLGSNSGGLFVRGIEGNAGDGEALAEAPITGFLPATQLASFTFKDVVRKERQLLEEAQGVAAMETRTDAQPTGLPVQALRAIRAEALAVLQGRILDCAVINTDPQQTVAEMCNPRAADWTRVVVQSRHVIMSEKSAVGLKEARGIRVQRIPQAALDILQDYCGEVVKCTVSSVLDWGVFCDFDVDTGPPWEGGVGVVTVTALIPAIEVSWLPISTPKRLLKVGDTVAAALLSVDMQRCLVALSLRALQPDPLLQTLERMLPDRPQDGQDADDQRPVLGDMLVARDLATILSAMPGVTMVEVGKRVQGRAFAQELSIYIAKDPVDEPRMLTPTEGTPAASDSSPSSKLKGNRTDLVKTVRSVMSLASSWTRGDGEAAAPPPNAAVQVTPERKFRLAVRFGMEAQEVLVGSSMSRTDFKALLNRAVAQLVIQQDQRQPTTAPG